MTKLLPAVAAALSSIFMTGCLFPAQSYHDVAYYDLATIRLEMPENLPILVDPFQSSESLQPQMTYLTNDNRVMVDSYNRWFQKPEHLITRYLQTAFSTNQPAIQEAANFRRAMPNGVRISGSVFSMRIDLKRREALLGVNYLIRLVTDGENALVLTNSGVFSARFNNESPVEFAAAMSEAAEKLVLQIQNEIHILQKQRGNDSHVKTTAPVENNNAH
jgi:hypothetical protein